MRAALIIAIVLAGCADPSPDAPAAPGAHDSLAWRLDGCAFVIVAVPVDAARLEAALPDGFALAPGRLAALPSGPSATIELDAYRCEIGAWGNATHARMSYGSSYTAVVPPDALREEGYDAYFVKWDPLVADPAARAMLVAAGMSARDGEASVGIAGARVSARVGLDDGSGFSFTGAMQQPGAPGAPLPFMEFTPIGENGALARWHARLHDAAIGSGAGVVEIAPGWVRELVGAERSPATFIAGTWNVDEADVGLR